MFSFWRGPTCHWQCIGDIAGCAHTQVQMKTQQNGGYCNGAWQGLTDGARLSLALLPPHLLGGLNITEQSLYWNHQASLAAWILRHGHALPAKRTPSRSVSDSDAFEKIFATFFETSSFSETEHGNTQFFNQYMSSEFLNTRNARSPL
jgi:hypothetical protein